MSDIPRFKSETSKLRQLLLPYCTGYGVDVGMGGDKIKPEAIGVDMIQPYANVGDDPVQLGGDGANLYWFRSGVLDYVYSSHYIEDLPNTVDVLREFTRVLKVGGHLVLNLPDEPLFKAHCARTGQVWNQAHSIDDMGINYMKLCFNSVPGLQYVYDTGVQCDYVFGIVAKKVEI